MNSLSSWPQSWGIHWFRRDLRLIGNRGFQINFQKNQGRVLGIFCFDKAFLSRDDFSHNRFAFFLKSLKALKKDLQRNGGDLLVVDQLPHLAIPQIIAFAKKHNLSMPLITWNRDYEPFARQRDSQIEKWLRESQIEFATDRDHLIFEPWELVKEDQSPYQVYTPFYNRWHKMFYFESGKQRIQNREKILRYLAQANNDSINRLQLQWQPLVNKAGFPYQDSLEEFTLNNQRQVTIPIPEGGWQVALQKLNEFVPKLQNYKTDRDIPSVLGTSRLSMFLKNGSLTTSQIISVLQLDQQIPMPHSGASQYLKELIWREFYYNILYHRPDCETSAYNKKYQNIAWQNNPEYFFRWKEGTTGFPIVDAGMRELLTTGWMHNRVRMIVASFLTKDLLIDWRWGENHFMKYLLDGDLAPNNGGWQWAASTGCDPQPYFRIFNPWLQGEKFDPDGTYIKKFVPELSKAPASLLHSPDAERSAFAYPNPIVSHAEQRHKALALFSVE